MTRAYFYCTHCKSVSTVEFYEAYSNDKNLVFETKLYYKCMCGSYANQIDNSMICIILYLNRYTKFKTIECCEGHLHKKENEFACITEYSPAYITFDNSITKDMFSNDAVRNLPGGWEFVDTKSGNICIRYNGLGDIHMIDNNYFINLKLNYISSIYKWCIKYLEDSDIIE